MTTENTNDTVNKDDELENEVPQMLNISDEEFEKLPSTAGVIESNPDPSNEGEGSTDTATADDANIAATSDQNNDNGSQTNEGNDANDPGRSEVQPASTDSVQDKPDTANDQQTINYEAEYKKLTAPFRANGTDIKINTVDEAITLMQMGANYHQKMLSLKPAMKAVKLLERNDLLDEGKLSFLIDLAKKDPDAIQKLVKDSGIDPMQIDVEQDINYTPKTTPVTDSEIALEDVLNKIETTPTYGRTLTVITKEWDTDSRATIANNPHIIEVINRHVADGIYDKVMGEVKRARTLGQLPLNVSDLEAYKQIGDIMHNKGLLVQQSAGTNAPAADSTPPVQKKDEINRDALRKAAGAPPAKRSQPAPVPKKNLLGISDEEFVKLPANAYTIVR